MPRARRADALSAMALAAALLGLAPQTRAQPAPALDLGAATASAADGTLYLEVSINGQPTQTVASFYLRGGKLLADVDDLYQLGFKAEGLQDLPELKRIRVDTTQGGAGKLVPLDRIPGLRYHYDAGKQAIDLSAGAQLLAPSQIGGPATGPVTPVTDRGLVLNYDAYVQGDPDHGASTTLSLGNEERLFGGSGIFDNTGVAYAGGERSRYTRLDSLWHHDDPQQLTTLQFGDAISSSLSWSRSVRLGGVQYRRNFALRPDLITFPVPSLSGSAAVPSSVDLYVNDVRQFSGEVPGGPFVINNPVALTGAGQARLVVRDELGREVSTTLPIYVDNRMVAQGLSSYSVESGVLRRNYGTASFDYGGTPAASGSWRYGWSDALTLESHAEGSSGIYNGGAGGLLRLGQWGVVDAAAAASAGGGSGEQGSGEQGSLGYQLILPRFSVVLRTVRNFGAYRDLAAVGGTRPPRIFDQINLSLPIEL